MRDIRRFEQFSSRVCGTVLATPLINAIIEAKWAYHGEERRTSWRGQPLLKDPFDFYMYSTLVWDLRPATIVELGAGSGASAQWLADMCLGMGLDTEIVSVDVKDPLVTFCGGKIRFVKLDLFDIPGLNEVLGSLRAGPILMIEDAHVNLPAVFGAVTDRLQAGDYLVVEDTLDPGKYEIFSGFMAQRGGEYAVDTKYLDLFGYNSTFNINSILKKV